jgi:type I restriction enzyme S subunit
LSACEIPLPPTNEQHRIVAKIEELFSELDKGIENLKTAQAQLKVYRQALLKHAFEGKLTAQWRAENQDKLETADALQKRIQQERAQRYQQQLTDWEKSKSPSVPLLQSGKTTSAAASVPHFDKGGLGGISEGAAQLSKPKAPKPLPPLTAEELAELPELPEGWGWVKYGDLCSIIRNGISAKPEGESGTPIFRISAVRPLFFDMTDIRFIDNATGKFDAYCLERGDLVFTRYNGSRRYVGVCAEYRSDEKRLFPDKLVQTRVFSKDMSTSYLEKALNSGASRKFVESKIRTTAGQSGVSGDDIKNIPVPFCSTDEQMQIVEELESKLSEVDQLDQTITTSLQQAEALRQSILKKAFSGQLVAQDANDEPASVLLARIKAEKVDQSDMVNPRKSEKTAAESAPVKSNVIPFPVKLAHISTTDLHAGILARAYQHHEHTPKYLAYFGHVKAEKIAHLVEAHLGIDLGREPIKAAAGPNDYPHLKKIESRAQKSNWFTVRQKKDGGGYVLTKGRAFDALLGKTAHALGAHAAAVDELMILLLPLNTKQAEIVATLYAAWNNLLLLGGSPDDEEIVYEARENWHSSKLDIERAKFFKGLEWMRQKGLVPAGKGRYVDVKQKRKTTRRPS